MEDRASLDLYLPFSILDLLSSILNLHFPQSICAAARDKFVSVGKSGRINSHEANIGVDSLAI